MLQSIRERATGWIAGVIFTLLIISMGLLGIRTYLNVSDVSNTVADVNGVSISRDALSVALQRVQRQFQANAQSIPAELSAHLKSAVLQSLINDELLKQAAVREGYRVSTLQTEDIIKAMPQFQVDGRFSPDRFQELMNAGLFSPASFLERVSTSLVVTQPKRGVLSTSLVLPDETKQAVALLGQKRHFLWLTVNPRYLVTNLNWHPIFTQQQIETYYQAHPADFQAPEQVSLDYVLLSENNLPKSQPASDQNFSKLREKLANLSYEHPESLTETAKELGLVVQSTSLFTRDKGGSDPVSASEAVRTLAFSADIIHSGNNSDVIELNPTTSIVVHLKAHQPARLMPLNDIKPLVIQKLQASATADKLKTVATQIVDSLKSGTTPAGIAAQFHGLSWQDVASASRTDSNPAPAIIKAAFSLIPSPDGEQSTFGMDNMDDAYVVIVLKEVKNAEADQNTAEYKKIAGSIETAIGDIEYDMYQKNLVHQAKIKIKLDENNS